MARPDLVFKQFVAVIDQRTTLICVDAAGQIQPIDEPFDTLAGEYQTPPVHIHCRSMVAPWLPGMVNDQRRLANAELKRRPKKVRDKRKYVNRIPGP